jgi:hypothetical protein
MRDGYRQRSIEKTIEETIAEKPIKKPIKRQIVSLREIRPCRKRYRKRPCIYRCRIQRETMKLFRRTRCREVI